MNKGEKGCKAKGCESKHHGLGYCGKHYGRIKRTGSELVSNPYSKSHGKSETKEYDCWVHIKDRCGNKNNKAYKDYGGRGVTVCNEWINDFNVFYLDMGNKPSLGHSIERINNEKGYYKENCKWATRLEQSRNKRVSKNSKSGVSGVRFESWNKWCSYIGVDGKNIYLGSYERKEDAVNVRKEAELKYW